MLEPEHTQSVPDLTSTDDMQPYILRRSLPWLCFVTILLADTGCTQQRTDAEFIPSEQDSQNALRTALDAWKAGQAAGPVPGTKPVIHVTDSSRIDGRKLESWKLLGPVPGNAPRCYAVSLQLAEPAEERRERYVIIGIDPLWVFRHEDYDLLLHWEHPMPKTPESATEDGSPEPAGKKESAKQ